MKVKKAVKIISILCLLLVSTGCWDSIELDDLGIVVAMGIDKEEEGFTMTLQIIKPQPKGQDGNEGKIWVGASSGQTLFDASKNFRAKVPARLTFMHNQIIIIGEKAAKDGLDDIIDFLSRNREIRYKSWVIITQGEAKKVLQLTPGLQPTLFEEIIGLIENKDEWAKQETSTIKDFLISFSNPYKDIVTARLILVDPEVMGSQQEEVDQMSSATVTMQKKIILDGASVIKGSKLSGWMTKTETRSYLFLKGKASEAIIVVPYKDGEISVEIGEVKSKFTPKFKKGKPLVEVEIKGLGRIGETNVPLDFFDIYEISKVEKILNQRIEGELKNSIEKFQGQYNADILGIGDMYFRSHTSWWGKNQHKWFKGLYQEVIFDIKVDIKIDNSGFLIQPVLGGN
ncbi:spore germination protein KC [Anaerobranca californiensis DSM 14826]|jgi:spore germination protein KC|uniref:Spore germination protein KC n=1 Tax=Anaerobranca californiensis DSM 14826 TaxID=1120989 RepID=A0A1M6Q593_9FIRM|nr:Ger(x)C family spore germination protein [Anaerobranca californiensis]SHK15303.1 spore germination protein KC [Anaerobranca californiensis DSM 14826]